MLLKTKQTFNWFMFWINSLGVVFTEGSLVKTICLFRHFNPAYQSLFYISSLTDFSIYFNLVLLFVDLAVSLISKHYLRPPCNWFFFIFGCTVTIFRSIRAAGEVGLDLLTEFPMNFWKLCCKGFCKNLNIYHTADCWFLQFFFSGLTKIVPWLWPFFAKGISYPRHCIVSWPLL